MHRCVHLSFAVRVSLALSLARVLSPSFPLSLSLSSKCACSASLFYSQALLRSVSPALPFTSLALALSRSPFHPLSRLYLSLSPAFSVSLPPFQLQSPDPQALHVPNHTTPIVFRAHGKQRGFSPGAAARHSLFFVPLLHFFFPPPLLHWLNPIFSGEKGFSGWWVSVWALVKKNRVGPAQPVFLEKNRLFQLIHFFDFPLRAELAQPDFSETKYGIKWTQSSLYCPRNRVELFDSDC